MLAVVVGDGEMHGIDAVEIFRIHFMLAAGQVDRLLAEIFAESHDDRIKHRHHRQFGLGTALDQDLTQFLVDDGKQHQTAHRGDGFHHAFHLQRLAHPGPGMGLDLFLGLLKLHQRRLGDRFQGLAGGVGHQMNMRPGGFRHQSFAGGIMGITSIRQGFSPIRSISCPEAGFHATGLSPLHRFCDGPVESGDEHQFCHNTY